MEKITRDSQDRARWRHLCEVLQGRLIVIRDDGTANDEDINAERRCTDGRPVDRQKEPPLSGPRH